MSLSAPIATAWVEVAPTASNFTKKLEGDIDASGAGRSVGGKFSAGFSSAIKTGALAVGVGAIASLGAAFSAGFDRLTSIENAEAKLRGLGHSAQSVTAIMDNALKSVQGTSFGMAEAGATAAGAVAAGIAPGEDLERTLKLVADAATIAGTDMGSMGAIFNKVASSNKMQMDVANQLMDAGIPVMQLLAAEMGVTAEEATKMASAGEISFDRFRSAIENGMGGAALSAGDTVTGAIANMGNAFARLGAELVEPFFDSIGDGARSATGWMDELTKSIEGYGTPLAGLVTLMSTGVLDTSLKEAFGWTDDSPAVDFFVTLGETFEQVRTAFAPFEEAVKRIGDAFAPLLPVLLDVWTSLSPLGLLLPALEPVLAVVADLVGTLAETLGSTLASALEVVSPILETVSELVGSTLAAALEAVVTPLLTFITDGLELLGPMIEGLPLETLASSFTDIVTALTPLIPAVLSLLTPFLELATPLTEISATALPPLITGLVQLMVPLTELTVLLINTLVPAITTVIDIFSGLVTFVADGAAAIADAMQGGQGAGATLVAELSLVGQTFLDLWTQAAAIFSAGWAFVQSILDGAKLYIDTVFVPIFSGLSAFFEGVWLSVQTVFTTAWAIIQQIVAAAILVVQALFTGNFEQIGVVVSTAWENIKALFSGALSSILTNLSAGWESLKQGVADAVAGFLGFFSNGMESAKTTVSDGTDGIVGFFTGLPDKILAALSNAGEWLVDVGKNIVQGLIDGVTGMIDTAVSAVTDLGSSLVDGAKETLGIHSPSRVFRDQIGKQIGAGVEEGINDSIPGVQSSMLSLVEPPDVPTAASMSALLAQPAGAYEPSAAARAAGMQVTQNFNGQGLPASAVAEHAAHKIANMLR